MATNIRCQWQWVGWLIAAVGIVLAGWVTPLYAQDSCTQIITRLRGALTRCEELNSNYACYGRAATFALPTDERFNRPGDRLPINVLQTILTQHRGAAFMYLHLDDGQDPVKVVLYGDVGLNPVGKNAFILRYENNTPLCADTPPGLVVQTVDGERGRITVNGVDVELQSTAFVTMQSNEVMNVVNIAGQVTVNIPNLGINQPLPPGQQVPITQRNGVPLAAGEPTPATVINSAPIQWLTENGLVRVTDPNTQPHPNIAACGGALAYGQTATGENLTPGQECLFTFNGAAGDVVTINLEATSATLNPWVDLRGPDDQLLKANDNVSESDQDSAICNRALPVTGVYTIVARPRQNGSTGSFQLTLNRTSNCTPPPPQCEVITQVVLYSAPQDETATVVQTLAPGERFRPLARSADERWLQVALLPAGAEGWVHVTPYEILCDGSLDDLSTAEPPAPAQDPAPVEDPVVLVTPAPAPPACFRVQPADWCAYRVRAGDTLSDIARRSDANLGRLREVNCRVYDDIIRIGEILFVPCPPIPATPVATPIICPPLNITSLNHDGVGNGIIVVWQATGGCDPLTGRLTVAVPASQPPVAPFAVTERSGNRVIPYPHLQRSRTAAATVCTTGKYSPLPCPTPAPCTYTLDYTLVLSDSTQQTQASGSVPIQYPCG